jgi:Tfp pilus assembly protein PilF
MRVRLLVLGLLVLTGPSARAQVFQHVPLTGNPAAQSQVWQAVTAIGDGLPDIARRHLAEALRTQPDMVVAHLLEAEVARVPEERKQHLDAATTYARAQKLTAWEKVWLQIDQHQYTGKAAAALKGYDALIKAQPLEPWFYIFRGQAHAHQAGTPPALEKARVDFEKAVQLWPSCRAAWNLLGYTYVAQNKLPDALNALAKYAQLAPRMANPHDSMGEVLLRAKRLQDADAEYRTALRLDPAFINANVGLGYTLVNIGLSQRQPGAIAQGHQQLETAFHKAVEPRVKALAIELIAAVHLLEGKHGPAVAALERYEAWARQVGNPELVARALLYAASVHAVLGAYRQASLKADEAARLPLVTPERQQAVLARRAVLKALMLVELGELAAAEARVKELAKLAAAAGWVQQTVGELKAVALAFAADPKAKTWDALKAAQAARLLANATDDQPMALYYLGRAQQRAGDAAGGRATLERVAGNMLLRPEAARWRFAAMEALRPAGQ